MPGRLRSQRAASSDGAKAPSQEAPQSDKALPSILADGARRLKRRLHRRRKSRTSATTPNKLLDQQERRGLDDQHDSPCWQTGSRSHSSRIEADLSDVVGGFSRKFPIRFEVDNGPTSEIPVLLAKCEIENAFR